VHRVIHAPQAVASSSTPLFKTLTTTWRFQPDSEVEYSDGGIGLHRSHLKTDLDQGPTCVIFDLSYAFANPLYAAVSAAFFGQVSQLMVKAFEERCAEVYGPAA
jgi:coenzyme Q-binding protein COQ10